MLGLNIDLSLLGIIQPYLFFVFSGLSVINAIYLFAIFLQGKDLFQVWNKNFFIYNGEPENITEDRIVEIEKEAASSHSLVSDLISRIREISSDRKELSLDEIHEIIDPKISSYEIKLNQGASTFIYFGLFFTVAGLLFGLLKLQDGFDANSIKAMLSNLEVAFSTTIIGLILSIFPKNGQSYISRLSDSFRHSFTVFARN